MISRIYSGLLYSSPLRSIHLTFDDGPSENLNNVLQVLKRYNVTATFFIVGHRLEGKTSMLEPVFAGGHSIGNHSYAHESAPKQDFEAIAKDYKRCESLISSSYPDWKCNFIRPPYGDLSWALIRYAFKNKQKLIMWTKDSIDYRSKSIEEIYRNLGNCSAGDIILFHDEFELTVNFLERFIPEMQAKGFNFCKL